MTAIPLSLHASGSTAQASIHCCCRLVHAALHPIAHSVASTHNLARFLLAGAWSCMQQQSQGMTCAWLVAHTCFGSDAWCMTHAWCIVPTGQHITRAAVRQQGGQISDDLTVVVVDMLPSSTTFPEVAANLTRSHSNGSLGSAGRPPRAKSSGGLKSFFKCGSEPAVLEEFEPSFHDPSVRDPSHRGRGDYSHHADVNIIADVDSHVEFAHLSPMSVARQRQQQQKQLQLQQQQQQQVTAQPQQTYVSPFAQPLARDSSDSASSSIYFQDNSTHASGNDRQALRHQDYTTHAGGQIPPGHQNLQKVSKNNSGILRTFSRGSVEEELTPPYGSKQSTVHNVTPLGRRSAADKRISLGERRNSIGDKVLRTLSRNSLGPRQDSVHLEKVSATHYGGQTPNLVPLRQGSGPPEKMIVDPTTHAVGNFKQRRSGRLSGDLGFHR